MATDVADLSEAERLELLRGLNDTELQVLRLRCKGRLLDDIAREIGYSSRRVDDFMARIHIQLGLERPGLDRQTLLGQYFCTILDKLGDIPQSVGEGLNEVANRQDVALEHTHPAMERLKMEQLREDIKTLKSRERALVWKIATLAAITAIFGILAITPPQVVFTTPVDDNSTIRVDAYCSAEIRGVVTGRRFGDTVTSAIRAGDVWYPQPSTDVVGPDARFSLRGSFGGGRDLADPSEYPHDVRVDLWEFGIVNRASGIVRGVRRSNHC